MINYIKSSDNRIAKLIRQLGKKSVRDEKGLFIAEGMRIVKDALSSDTVDFILSTSPCADIAPTQYITDEKLFERLSDTRNPQGIMAVCRMSHAEETILKSARLVLVCENISDPGNLGTMLRSCEAAGADAVILAGNTVDLYNPKTVRSTMGSIFRVPVFCGDVYVDRLKADGFLLAATCLDGSESLYDCDFNNRPIALVIGSEAHGVSKAMLEKADLRIRIPMSGQVESLNAAIAASVCLYEIKRRNA